MSKRAALYTLGCRLNQSETALLTDRLLQAGYTIVPFDEPADLGIINTCTVTHEADAKCRKAIRAFIRKNPNAYVAVIGCYSQLQAQAVAQIEGVDLIIGNRAKLDILDKIARGKQDTPSIVVDTLPRDHFRIDTTASSDVLRRANLKIQEGCAFMCAYCIVPYARGVPRSRDIDNAITEAHDLVARGAKEIVLTGVNVGAYTYNGHGLIDIIDRLNDIPNLTRIRLSSIELNTIPDGLLARMDAPDHAIVPFLHVPLQSGSDTILNLMRRTYTTEEARALLEAAQASVRDICIGTDIIVGFPGETEEHFNQTCRFFIESPMTYAHVFKYSPRKGTPAERMPGRADPDTLNRRSAELRRLVRQKRRQFHQQHIGRTMTVLFEQSTNGTWTGYTPNYIRVAVDATAPLANTIHPVRLTESHAEHMRGTINE